MYLSTDRLPFKIFFGTLQNKAFMSGKWKDIWVLMYECIRRCFFNQNLYDYKLNLSKTKKSLSILEICVQILGIKYWAMFFTVVLFFKY